MRGRRVAMALLAAGGIVATAVPATTAEAAPGPDLRGHWNGVVVWPIQVNPAHLTVTRSRPLRGTIVLPGLCAARWSEVGRSGNRVRVFAHVVRSPRCRSNFWDLIVTGNSMTGPGVGEPGNWVRLTRGGGFFGS
ncbi:MAG: hypothetical protein QM634_10005 [Gordonia sp. (in: high G+C Gram-positive bacteria)]